MSEAPQVSKQEQNWAMFCHLSALAGLVMPFGNLVGPLIVWLIKRSEMPMVDAHGKEVLNFQMTVTIAAMVSMLLMFVLIGFLLLAVVGIGALVLTIRAAIKVSNGEFAYGYPWTIRFLK